MEPLLLSAGTTEGAALTEDNLAEEALVEVVVSSTRFHFLAQITQVSSTPTSKMLFFKLFRALAMFKKISIVFSSFLFAGFRGPAPWEQPSYGGGYDGGFDGGYGGGGYDRGFDGGYPPRRGGFGGPPVSIPSTKPPPPPEEPPADQPSNPWEQQGGGGSWPGMMPHVMPPWMTGPMGVQIPSVPPAPPSQPPPPN